MASPDSQPPAVRQPVTPQRMPANRPGTVVTAQSVQYIGPTPPPDHIEIYERLCPGAAGRFLTIAEGEISHRRGIENRQIEIATDDAKTERRLAHLGQIFGFLIAVGGIAGGIYLSMHEHPVPGSIIGGGSLATIILAFLRRPKK